MRESALKSRGSASCSSSMQSLSERPPEREYLASAHTNNFVFDNQADFILSRFFFSCVNSPNKSAAGELTSVVAGRDRIGVTGLLHFMAAPVSGCVIFSWVPITLLPLLQHIMHKHNVGTGQILKKNSILFFTNRSLMWGRNKDHKESS